jgi:hypothetical protein
MVSIHGLDSIDQKITHAVLLPFVLCSVWSLMLFVMNNKQIRNIDH